MSSLYSPCTGVHSVAVGFLARCLVAKNKFHLSKETLKRLTGDELSQVASGLSDNSNTWNTTKVTTLNAYGLPSNNCNSR
jgi:hypothetical protein